MVVHKFNPSTWETETQADLQIQVSLKTEWVPEQSELHRESLFGKNQNK